MNLIEFDRLLWEDICTTLMLYDFGYRPNITEAVVDALEKSWGELETKMQAQRFIVAMLEQLKLASQEDGFATLGRAFA